MIRINLLGKKKVANIPFGLDEKIEKLGISVTDLQEMRPGLIRLAVVAAGLYLGNYVPTYLHEQKKIALDAEINKLTAKSGELQKELASKKDIRKQMDQLNKEEVELQRQLNAVTSLKQGRGLAFNTLNDIVGHLNKTGKVWIDDVKYEKVGDRISVALNGKSWEYFPVNEFVRSITESTRYTDVKFKEVSAERAQKLIPGVPEQLQKTKKFGIEFLVKEGE